MKGTKNIGFSPLGVSAILMKWEEKTSTDLLEIMLQAKAAIHKKKKGIIDLINTYDSLLIKYDAPVEHFEEEVESLKNIVSSAGKITIPKRMFRLPVCYDRLFGTDLQELGVKKKLNDKELIALHTDPVYIVYFTGFLPGFPYLGGLSEKLFIERKNRPRKKIPQGAVGIGGKQTGIYPLSSPGGWQIIGNCPVQLFNPTHDPPCLLQAADRVKFYPVSWKEYRDMEAAVKAGNFHLKPEE